MDIHTKLNMSNPSEGVTTEGQVETFNLNSSDAFDTSQNQVNTLTVEGEQPDNVVTISLEDALRNYNDKAEEQKEAEQEAIRKACCITCFSIMICPFVSCYNAARVIGRCVTHISIMCLDCALD